MGVKDLWAILSPVCERKSLYELQGKTVAIDLSGWVVEGQSVAEYSTQPRMYLRNLFFRTTCLLLLGVKPVFVLEGSAPTLKQDTMARRNETQARQHRKQTQSSQSSQLSGNKGARSRLRSLTKQCEEMLRILGVSCVQSIGEAEALCAQLNELGLVDGCITQDSDCFLYGASTVYRNFTISGQGSSASSGYSIDVYEMADIEERLRLTRERLVALSLICGCDYGQGVNGAGKQAAKAFLDSLDKNVAVLDRLRRWRSDPYFERLERERVVLTTAGLCDVCCHTGRAGGHESRGCAECGLQRGCRDNLAQRVLTHATPEDRKTIIAELNLRKKALLDLDFPSQEMMDEFLQRRPRPKDLDLNWKEPDLPAFIKFATKLLSWTQCYAVGKFLPLVTRWQLTHLQATKENPSHLRVAVSPRFIVKTRVRRGIACYELRWSDNLALVASLDLDEGVTEEDLLMTVEPQSLVADAYQDLVETFLTEKEAAKNAKRKPRPTKKKVTAAKEEPRVSNRSSQKNDPLKQLSLNNFVQRPEVTDKEIACRVKPKGRGNREVGPRITIASLTRRFGKVESSASLDRRPRINDIMCNPVREVDNIIVRPLFVTKGSEIETHTSLKRFGSPSIKAESKNKMTKHRSSPLKLPLSVHQLESSFKNMSIVDDLDDLDSNDDISDLSALIDSIVGCNSPVKHQGGSQQECKNTDFSTRTGRCVGATDSANAEVDGKCGPGENYDWFKSELLQGHDCGTPLEQSFECDFGEPHPEDLLSQSVIKEFEEDEFDVLPQTFVPLMQRLQRC